MTTLNIKKAIFISCELTKIDIDSFLHFMIFSEKAGFDDNDDIFPVVCSTAKQPCWFMLPLYPSKGHVGAGAPLFVVNTKKSEKGKESSKTEHGGEHFQGRQMKLKGYYASVKSQYGTNELEKCLWFWYVTGHPNLLDLAIVYFSFLMNFILLNPITDN